MLQISSSDLDDAKYKHMIIRIHVYNSIYNKPIKLFLNFYLLLNVFLYKTLFENAILHRNTNIMYYTNEFSLKKNQM